MKYKYLVIPFITLILAQIIKFLVESIQNKKFNFSYEYK